MDNTDFGFSADERRACEMAWENGENERILSQILPRFTYTGPTDSDESDDEDK